MAKKVTEYYPMFKKYLALYPNLSNVSLAKEMIEKEDLDVRASHLRQVLGEYLRDMIPENVRLAKKVQRFQDSNRVERKGFREYARIENAVTDYAEAIKLELEKNGEALKKLKLPVIKSVKNSAVGIFQVSDWHGNELIDLPHNRFDFTVLAKRAQKQVELAKRFFHAAGVTKVVFIATGDMLNSDRRLDEMTSQATNRAKASLLTMHILKQVILDLRQNYEVDIISVMGNESRIKKDMTFFNKTVSDNYDFTIFAHLKEIFTASKIKGINFISIDKMEEVVNILGKNWLITHDYKQANSKQKDTQSTYGRYRLAGVNIDFMVGGHIHTTRITDINARSSSMPGSNEYNEHSLNLAGKAGQNIYIATKGSIHKIALDLQDVKGVPGYDIIEALEAYNAKSADKTREVRTIFKVIV